MWRRFDVVMEGLNMFLKVSIIEIASSVDRFSFGRWAKSFLLHAGSKVSLKYFNFAGIIIVLNLCKVVRIYENLSSLWSHITDDLMLAKLTEMNVKGKNFRIIHLFEL